ncbi:MAG: DUF1080 domain-containing protein [Bryobacteraceae bacterium]|nr:DUF1080 domain-containing protein [Bryobacteraceae bacterium]
MRLKKLALSLAAVALLLPANLSQSEAQEGWILLHDGENGTGWAGDGAAFISGGGVLAIDGTGLLRSQSPFADFVLRFDVRALTPQANVGLILRANREGAPKDTGYEIQLGGGDPEWPFGSIVGQAKANGALPTNAWVAMEVEANGGSLVVRSGGRVVASASGLQGAGGLIVLEANRGGKVEIRNPRLKPLSPQMLFNGNDLSGWKSTGTQPKAAGGIGKMLGLGKGKPKEVKWTVGGGAIHGEEGPGQLESLLPMGDFLLQADVRVNSKKNENKRKYLLLLRGDPGQLGTGYEVNLQPGLAGGVAPLAPSRKPGGKLNTFSTITVSAYNRHFQVWVDGVLTADADDVRAEGVNPKKEARTTPGAVAFYSPDEDVNLDIRNVKAIQLPKVLGHVRKQAAQTAVNAPPPMTLPAVPATPSAPPPTAAGGGNDQQLKLLQEQMKQQQADKKQQETQKQQVSGLLQQALKTNDPAAQLSLYDQILLIDPDNQVAFTARKEAQGKLDANQAKQYEETQKAAAAQAEQAQKEKDFAKNLDAAQTAFLAGNLVVADQALSAAEKVFPGNPAVTQIRQRLDAARGRASSIFTLGAAGLGTAVLAGLAWLFMARGKKDPFVEITVGLDKGKKFNIDQQVMKLGAIAEDGGQKNDVVLRDAERMVSRFHAEIHQQEGKLYVIDANSSNGTFVDKKRIPAGKPIPLAKGSVVSFGGTCAVKIGFEKRSKNKTS